jgi:hypothetical protein
MRKLIIIALLVSVLSGCGFFKGWYGKPGFSKNMGMRNHATNGLILSGVIMVAGGVYYIVKNADFSTNETDVQIFECSDQWCYNDQRLN